ncbi:MAG: acyltransferase [Saprospiraceae bacterium]
MAEKKRILYADYIRVIAAFGVVQMHTVGAYLYMKETAVFSDPNWMTANVYYGFLRWCTPFFIMLSGMFLLDPARDEPTAVFLKRRVGKVLKPFAFWALIYLTYKYRGYLFFGTPLPWGEIGKTLLFGDPYYHLWFIPMIIGLYLLTPIFQKWTKLATRQDVEYFLALSFTIVALQHLTPGIFVVKYIGWMGHIGYYVLGYYLTAFPIRERISRWIYGAALLMPPLSSWLVWHDSVTRGQYSERFFIYQSPNIMLMTFAWFLFLRTRDWGRVSGAHEALHRFIMTASYRSFGIYFVHVLLVDVFKNGYLYFKISPSYLFNLTVAPWYGAFLAGACIFLLSYWLVGLLLRIRPLRAWIQ